MKVTVAGAGVFGLATALALADAGCDVTVFDPAPATSGASGVAAGMIAPVFEAVLDVEARPHFGLLLAARDLWPALAARAGVDIDRAGAMAVGSVDWLDAVAASMTRLGLHPSEVPAGRLAPGLLESLRTGLMTREDWRLEPAAAIAALRAAAQAAGVIFRRAAATGMEGADRLVVATGVAQGLADLAPQLRALEPIKGHILQVDLPTPRQVVVRGEGVYAAPSVGGLRVGATMEAGVADPAADPARAAPLAAAGAQLFPRIAAAPRELLAGVRAATADGLPLVGTASDPRVILAVGARRNGWLLAPLVARAAAAAVLGADPGRFGERLAANRLSLRPDAH
ncbi:NAD(P)/FAD-dependent oxidoreductase [Phenylobacterium immobile]|uniref:NAD(P)/FAD-dependent oxidoreductase n=1 Tax=Phenylobacterium immobile TaxID=21 RepID=UPI001FE01C08|nr:FAD-dependent oxidoreductase [Phenylobacterium immobile]